jgi:hypothetical protein
MEGLADPGATRVRALRQWAGNGLDELTVGLFFCFMGGMVFSGFWASKAKVLGHFAMIEPLLIGAGALATEMALKKVRARLIFPRTGYVAFRSAESQLWMLLPVLGLVAAVALAVGMLSSLPDLSWAWGPAIAAQFAAGFLWAGVRYRLPQYIWLAGLALLLGAVTFAAGAKIEGAMWVMVGVGIAMASDGALRMKRFLRTHPVEAHHIGDQHG